MFQRSDASNTEERVGAVYIAHGRGTMDGGARMAHASYDQSLRFWHGYGEPGQTVCSGSGEFEPGPAGGE